MTDTTTMKTTTTTTPAGPVPFDFQGHTIRTVTRPDGSHWFVADDIARALGYRNTSKAVADHVDPEDKSNQSLDLQGSAPVVINESGLYSLVLRSRKPAAKDFKRWVTSVVLPSLRRHGVYIAGEELDLLEGLSLEELNVLMERRRASFEVVSTRIAAIVAQKEAEAAAYRARMLEYRQDRDDAFQALRASRRFSTTRRA